jgi:hypothetical protein
MAVLPDQDREDVAAEYMRECASRGVVFSGVLKADVKAMLNALDVFFNTNASAINNAIPLPARTALSTSEKAMAAAFVIQKRFVKGV